MRYIKIKAAREVAKEAAVAAAAAAAAKVAAEAATTAAAAVAAAADTAAASNNSSISNELRKSIRDKGEPTAKFSPGEGVYGAPKKKLVGCGAKRKSIEAQQVGRDMKKKLTSVDDKFSSLENILSELSTCLFLSNTSNEPDRTKKEYKGGSESSSKDEGKNTAPMKLFQQMKEQLTSLKREIHEIADNDTTEEEEEKNEEDEKKVLLVKLKKTKITVNSPISKQNYKFTHSQYTCKYTTSYTGKEDY